MEGFDKENVSGGVLEQLRDRIFELKKESLDPYFTEYLANLQERVIREKHAVDLLCDELERKYKFYLERMEKQAEDSVPEQTVADNQSVQEGNTDGFVPDAHPQEMPVETPVAEKRVYVVDAPVQATVKTKKNKEFTFGIVAFSVVGVFFLLAAFVMLGQYFMNSVAKGISMYAIALVICIFSEALVRRRSSKFSLVLTILGISGIHVATFANTDSMLHINQMVAGIIMALTTVLALCYDKLRRRKSWKMDGISAGAYYAFAIAFSVFYIGSGNDLSHLFTLSLLVILTRLLAREKVMYPLDSVMITMGAIYALAKSGTVYGYIMLGVLLVSTLLIRFWHMYYQCLITLTVLFFVAFTLESEIVLTLIVAILWLFMLLFNHVGFIRGKMISSYNYFAVVLQAFCYLGLVLEDYDEYKILYFILTFLGGGFIYFMFQERYCLPEKGRGLILSIFLSYMTLVSDFTYPITASILLLVIGLFSIGCGFVLYDKKIRIYGLVLALFVCVKITLSDFAGGEPLQRMLLFFAAGVVALIISGIYILLEKKYMKD